MRGGVRIVRSIAVVAGLAVLTPASVTAQSGRLGPVERPPGPPGPPGGVGGVPGGFGQTPLGPSGLGDTARAPPLRTGPDGLAATPSPGATAGVAAQDTPAELTAAELDAAAEETFEALIARLPIVEKARIALGGDG